MTLVSVRVIRYRHSRISRAGLIWMVLHVVRLSFYLFIVHFRMLPLESAEDYCVAYHEKQCTVCFIS